MNKMVNLLLELTLIIINTFLIYKLYKEYKESTFDGKHIFRLTIIIVFFPIVIYLLDSSNFASNTNALSKLDLERWFDFIVTYVTTLVSAFIGAIFLVIMTNKQLQQQKESEKEDKRIANMPLLTYEFNCESSNINGLCLYLDGENVKNARNIGITCKIENIGLGPTRRFGYKIESNTKDLGHDSIQKGILKVNESLTISLVLNVDDVDIKKIRKSSLAIPPKVINLKFVCFYEDLLKNVYEQEIHLSVTFGYYRLDSKKKLEIFEHVHIMEINDEKLIDKYPDTI